MANTELPELFLKILKLAVDMGASDVHLKVGLPPIVRLGDRLKLLSKDIAPLGADMVDAVCRVIVPEHLQPDMNSGREVDVAYGVSGLGRFRINIFRQRSQVGMICRVIPFTVKTLDELGLPVALKKVVMKPQGLILVTGATGSGKSTTMAAMIQEWNMGGGGHIITIEDPIEFLIRDRKAILTQREVGIDTESFQTGLKFALRQDPDIIMVGEIRDWETLRTCLSAAETGHLVFTTLHTKNTSETINRILGMAPPEAQNQVRMQLAAALNAVISQRIVTTVARKEKNQTAPGRVAAVEILINTPRVQECIINPEKTGEILDCMEAGEDLGMQTFDAHLLRLLRSGEISEEVALAAASNPADFELKLRGVGGLEKGQRW